jgi:hypothetical protein
LPNDRRYVTTITTSGTLTHGRTRKRWAERAVIVLLVIAGAIFFVAWAIGLALLILLLTY